MLTIDSSLFFMLHNLAGHSMFGDSLIIFFAKYLLYFVAFIFGLFIFQSWRKGNISKLYSYGMAVLTAIVARFGLASLIRFFFHRPRPFLVFNISHLINNNEYSFPSGHTIFLFALATATYFFNKRLAYFLYISGILIGLARVAAGVHYPSDIVGGIVLGVFTGIIMHKYLKKYFTLRK